MDSDTGAQHRRGEPLAPPPLLGLFRVAATVWLLAGNLAHPADTAGRDPRDDSARFRILLWIRANGAVSAAEVIRTSGDARFDAMAAWKFLHSPEPPTVVGGVATDAWAIAGATWKDFGGDTTLHAWHDVADEPVPRLRTHQALRLDPPYYPETAIRERSAGYCSVRVTVTAAGVISGAKLYRSSGDRVLDRACIDTARAADYEPAMKHGAPVDGTAEIWLAWRLPGP